MRLPVALATLLLIPASAAAQPADADIAQPSGTLRWSIEPTGMAGRIQLEISRRSGDNVWQIGHSVEASSLEGLDQAALTRGGPIRFRISHDAGTLDCSGVARGRDAGGECSFAANAAFSAALVQRGIGAPTPNQQFSMALNDVGFAYVEEVARQGYETPRAADLADAGDHGVTLAYLRGMSGHGYRVGRLSALIRMRDHGVTPDYIEALAARDVRDIPPDEIVELRDHGVSADYVGQLRTLGYRRLSTGEMIQLRDHGVSADYVRTLADNGIRDIAPEELTRMRDHGVSPEFVVALRRAGYSFGTDEIVRLRDHGVSGSFVGELRTLGYADIAADDIVRLRDNGVSSDFIRRANGGGERLAPEELVRRRNGG